MHVPQELLAVGGGAVLVDHGLRLSHQDIREQAAAGFEDLCKTADTLEMPEVNIKPMQGCRNQNSLVLA